MTERQKGRVTLRYLHNSGVLPDPVVEGAGKLFKLFESSLCLGIEERMAGRGLGEHVIQLGHVGDDRLLVRFGGINICTKQKNFFRFFTEPCIFLSAPAPQSPKFQIRLRLQLLHEHMSYLPRLRIRIRIISGSNRVSGSGIRIQEGKNDPQK
jgi:hypothetical protein